MNIYSILQLCGGLAFFLFGMHVMSGSLEKLAGGNLQKILKEVTSNPIKSLFFGAIVTIAIQSSSALTVMLVGLVNSGISASGDTAPLMSCIPYMSTAKPAMMIPTSLRFSFLLPIIIITPISAMTGEKFSGFNIEMNRLSLSIPERLRIHAVRVVPMLEPMMTPTVWASSMMPEFTSPTSITVSLESFKLAVKHLHP